MNFKEANQLLDEQKYGIKRYPEHIITDALRFTGDLSGNLGVVSEPNEKTGVASLRMGLREEIEHERHIGAVRRSGSRTQNFV